MKKAIIIGIKGQDGRYLEKLLCNNNYEIIGIGKDYIISNFSKSFKTVNICDFSQLSNLIKLYKPDEIYFLAAHHHSSEDDISDDLSLFNDSFSINVNGIMNCLEGVKCYSNNSRIFYAASHHVFGFGKQKFNNEKTPLNPESIYGISKTAAVHLCKYYRNKYGLYVAIGYLYNHESPYRKDNYLSKKVIETVKKIKKGEKHKLFIGDLKAKIDWGYAKDYVDAIHKIIQLERPEDFIICSNNIESVSNYVKAVFSETGLNYKNYVVEKPTIIKKEKQKFIRGDCKKLKSMIDWDPKTNFKELVRILINEEIL